MKRNIRNLLVAAAMSAAGVTGASAMPAYPKPIKVQQPDGTTITVCLRGDERLNWAETTDGYTLLRDSDGFWTFAKAGKGGQIASSSLRYMGTSVEAKAQGIKPGLRYTAEQRARLSKKFAAPQTKFLVDGSFPTSGKRKLLVLLVNYSDTKTTYTQQNFYDMMNKEGYGGIGSFRDFYKEQSYGNLDIDVTVTDWITLPKPKGTYGSEGAPYMIYDALSILSKTMDLKQFDNDGDGILDGLAVIHQGTGQEMSGSTDDIWSHSAIIYGQTFNGVSVRRYTIEPEKLATDNRMSTIGVICHEFGHALGAPDFYDTDYSGSGGEFCGTGVWDLLGSGAWSGDYGDRPTGINGWQKYIFGWVEPKTLDESTVVADMPDAVSQPVAYRMETGTPGEYFYMENRQQNGFDKSLPGHGLVVYHVNENLIRSKLFSNDINATYPQGIYTVCSDAGVDPELHSTSFGDVNSAAAPFPGEYSHTEFSDETLPSTHSSDGRYAYRALSDITDVNGKVGFKYTHYDEPEKPSDLKAMALDGSVLLTWNQPAGSSNDDIDHYTVYRNNEKISTTIGKSWMDTKAEGGKLLSYQVDVTYKNQLVSHPVSTEIMVPSNKVTALTATVTGSDVKLTWETNNVLQWADTSVGTLTYQDFNRESFAYANRYSAENLATYVGGKITHVGFVPMQGPSELTVKLKVYEADADGSNAQVVSERSVKEFAKAQPRDLKLTKAVTIKPNKEYWVVVECVGSKGVVTVACDQSTVVSGFGNCSVEDGKLTTLNGTSGNFYITATITPPASDSGVDLSADSETADPALDFYYPKGFIVYCDGKEVARTTARTKTFTNVPEGERTYKVASLFKGNNQSKATTCTVTVSTTGIESANATSAALKTVEGGIGVDGFNGTVGVADPSGRTVAAERCDNSCKIALQPGVYIVTLSDGNSRTSQKVAVY